MNDTGSGQKILNKVSKRIIAITSARMVLASFVGFLVTATLINSKPFGVEQLKDITGGVGLLDMELLYTPNQAYAHLTAMGEAGRTFDLTHIIPLDFVFPLMYMLFYAVTITWLLHKWLPEASQWHQLNVIPLVGGIADYLENFGIITMLIAWPDKLPDIAIFTMVADLVKFTCIILSVLIIIGALTGWVIRIFKGYSGRSPIL